MGTGRKCMAWFDKQATVVLMTGRSRTWTCCLSVAMVDAVMNLFGKIVMNLLILGATHYVSALNR